MNKSDNGRYLQRFIPARVVFVALGFLGFCLVYAFKVVLAMTIVVMVSKTNGTSVNTNSECPAPNATTHHNEEGDFDWSDTVQGYVLGSFFYGYVVTQFPAGIIANKFGGKWIFSVSLLIASVMSIVSPFAAKSSYQLFIAARVIQGLAEGVVFPCMNGMIACWMPKNERSRGTSIIYSGSQIGTLLTLPITAMLNDTWGWSSAFYILGISGAIWFVLFAVLVYESPEDHPHISDKEKQFILDNDGGKKERETSRIPYKEMFTSKPLYALTITHFGQNWGFITILSLMPLYMKKVLHTDITQDVLISGLPYLGQALFAWFISYLTDRLRETGKFEITTLRKMNSFIAYIPSAICMALVPLVECNQTLSCLFIILAMTFNGASFSGFQSTHVDMAPDFAGTLMGITNCIGNFPGFMVPSVAALFYEKGQTVENWSFVFYLSSAVFVFITIVYCFFCTAQEQSWGRRRKDNKT